MLNMRVLGCVLLAFALAGLALAYLAVTSMGDPVLPPATAP